MPSARSCRLVTTFVALSLVIATAPSVAVGDPVMVRGDVGESSIVGTFTPSGWSSSLYPPGWTPGYSDAEGRQVADFSYAGYRQGAEPIPSIVGTGTVDVTKAPYFVSTSGTRDVTRKLQAALDDVGRSGGGVVYLPPGKYRVARRSGYSGSLVIRYDNVVLRGAGRGRTFILSTSRNMRRAAVIKVAPTDPVGWASAPTHNPNLAADSFAGSREVHVSNPGNFQVGELVIIRTEATPEWLAKLGNPLHWTITNTDATTFLRRVVDVRGDGALVLDAPLLQDVLVRHRGAQTNVYRAGHHLSGIGVEDLSIGMVPHSLDSRYLYDTHESSAIRLTNVVDSWVQRVGSYRATRALPYNLLSEGIWLDCSRNVTVRGCVMSHPQNRSAGNGNGYVIRGSDNLIESCAAVGSRHPYSFAAWFTTGNVLTKSASARPRYFTDFHAWLASVNLLDTLWLDGDSIDASYRNYGDYKIHGQTTSNSVIWNMIGVRPRKGGASSALVSSIQWGWGAAVGTSGKPTWVTTNPAADGRRADRTVDLAEGVGEGQTLVPSSLYADQLNRRTNAVGNYSAVGAVIEPSVERIVAPGSSDAVVVASSRTMLEPGGRYLITFELPRGLRVSRARLVINGSFGRRSSTIVVKALSSESSTASATTIKSIKRARVRRDPCVVDVSAFVRRRSAADADRVTLEVTQVSPGTKVLLFGESEEGVARRPRLELETSRSGILPADVVLGAAGSVAAADGRLSTSYGTYSRPTVTLDLGGARSIDGAGIAFGSGLKYFNYADVLVSDDLITWRPVTAVCGTGCSDDFEVTSLPERVDARYVRFVGVGRSDSRSPTYTAFREVEVYGR